MIEKALTAYDFAVSKGIEHHESYKLLKAAMVEELGKERAEKIEIKAAKNFMQLQKGIDKYFTMKKAARKSDIRLRNSNSANSLKAVGKLHAS